MMIEELVGKTIVFLNNIQLAHWQTKGYAEHEALGEYYTKLNGLNDKLVETWQGNQNQKNTHRKWSTYFYKIINHQNIQNIALLSMQVICRRVLNT